MSKMNRKEYLENLFNSYNEGKISAEAYDSALMNIDDFCEPEEFVEDKDISAKTIVEKYLDIDNPNRPLYITETDIDGNYNNSVENSAPKYLHDGNIKDFESMIMNRATLIIGNIMFRDEENSRFIFCNKEGSHTKYRKKIEEPFNYESFGIIDTGEELLSRERPVYYSNPKKIIDAFEEARDNGKLHFENLNYYELATLDFIFQQYANSTYFTNYVKDFENELNEFKALGKNNFHTMNIKEDGMLREKRIGTSFECDSPVLIATPVLMSTDYPFMEELEDSALAETYRENLISSIYNNNKKDFYISLENLTKCDSTNSVAFVALDIRENKLCDLARINDEYCKSTKVLFKSWEESETALFSKISSEYLIRQVDEFEFKHSPVDYLDVSTANTLSEARKDNYKLKLREFSNDKVAYVAKLKEYYNKEKDEMSFAEKATFSKITRALEKQVTTCEKAKKVKKKSMDER